MIYLIIVLLLLLSALFAALTNGLLGLSATELERKIKLGDRDARKVYAVRKKGNQLLCTLVLGNVAVNSALSIFWTTVVNSFIAGVIATSLIVIFGEILPIAMITRYPLKIGARSIWLVKVFMFILYPVAYPLSRLLDRALGAEVPTVWSKQELKEIIKFHEDRPESSVDANEERIILGALSYSDKIAADIMTPRSILFSLEVNAILDDKTLSEVKANGFTRIPVYRDKSDNIIGLLYAKDLIAVEPDSSVSDVYRHDKVLIIPETKKLGPLMNELIQGRNHLAVVYDEYGMLVGIVTLEDIVEEIMKVEIVDEADNIVDLRLEASKRAQKYLHK
ncbi:MAG: DUF21 domain-containing protein [Nitrospirae bacterium]|uniref:CNNM domain-containing protein n=1 Tax=Candidatus Magnetobacterium casense TaxID=1455061 RepID=UPI00058BBC66|nr:CNNM domain-containing protein [Candidatus Magnetobacterium casensis]MBF0338467.1 DUF21 domain-containing protein [Nitrospirota bacterium]